MKTIRKLSNRKLDELLDRLDKKIHEQKGQQTRGTIRAYRLTIKGMDERLRRIGL